MKSVASLPSAAPDAEALGEHRLFRHPEAALRVDGDAVGVAHAPGHPFAGQWPAAGDADGMVEGAGGGEDLHLLRAAIGDVNPALGIERQPHRLFQVGRDERRDLAVGDLHHALPGDGEERAGLVVGQAARRRQFHFALRLHRILLVEPHHVRPGQRHRQPIGGDRQAALPSPSPPAWPPSPSTAAPAGWRTGRICRRPAAGGRCSDL